MNTNLKYILVAIVVLALIAVFVFSEKLGIEIGSLLASVAGGYAIFKSKLLDKKASFLKLLDSSAIDNKEDWTQVKSELDCKYEALQARLDYLEYKTKLDDLKQANTNRASVATNNAECSLTEAEILKRLNS